MYHELATSDEDSSANNRMTAGQYELPEDIEEIIEASLSYSPTDVWMAYLATLPTDTPKDELRRIAPLFKEAVAEYLGVAE
ncbi:hypothetical protein [Aeromonas hydrophila]|uniref:hypothetical protein n=1 Tax=Aeromonas hydrophila TaxID=644 RepID=UPI003D252A87